MRPTLSLVALTLALFVAPLADANGGAPSSPPWGDDEVGAPGESVTIKTQDKLELAATYYAPGKRGRAPGALLIHGAGASQRQLRGLALYLRKKGMGVLTIDLRGHGRSASEDLDWDDLDEDGRIALWAHAAKDAHAGAQFLRSRTDIHASNLTVIGFGAGCQLAVRHARDDENARAVVLLDPEPDAMGTNIVRAINQLEGLPTLLVTTRDARDVSERIQHACHKANDGVPYIEIAVVPSTQLLTDKKLPNATYGWLKGQVMPQRR